MTLRRLAPALLVATLFATAASAAAAPPSQGQPKAGGAKKGTVRVAVINPRLVFDQMQETNDLRQRLEAEGARYVAQSKEKQAELEKLRNELRTVLKPDHPQYEERQRQLVQKAVEFEVWSKVAEMERERVQKRQVTGLYTKIERAVADYAAQQGIDLVLSNQQPEVPENIDPVKFNDLQQLLYQRKVVYSAADADITSEILALMDARYKGAGGGGGAASGGPATGADRRGTAATGGGGGGRATKPNRPAAGGDDDGGEAAATPAAAGGR